MTDKEKVKAYDEALERARKMLNMILDNEILGFPDQIREIFPQLRESEEKQSMTRKEAIDKVFGMIGTAEQHEALEFLVPEVRELRESYDKQQEDKRMLREIKRYIKEQGDKPTGLPNGTVAVADMITWLEKQKNTDFEIKALKDALAKQPDATGKPRINGEPISVENQAINIGDNETEAQRAYREGKNAGRKEVFDHPEEYGLEKIDNVFRFKIGDKVRLMDGDGRTHVIKAFEKVEGIHGPDFYHVVFEDDSASDHIIPDDTYPDGYFTCMKKVTEWSAEDEQMKVNILNALTLNLVYTVGKGTTTGTSTYRYDKEIAWFKALCLKQGRKDKD